MTHLIRAALFEDATNASERMGAGLAEIWVDDDLDVVISFEDHYWPDEKEPTAAIDVAAVLGIELELEVMWSDPLFAWPGLATVTQSTADLRDYPDVVKIKELRLMLDGICESTALSLLHQNKIKHFRIGNR